jgi:GT2 family glycosyltransferase
MKKITVIVPVHRIDGDYREMLNNSLLSLETFHNDVSVLIVCPKNVKDEITDLSQKLDLKIVENKGNTEFCNQVNLGIEKCKTEWFTILEMDDEFKNIWLTSMNEYMEVYPAVDVFLPIVKDVNVEGNVISYTNESAWAYGFTERQGFIDNDVLLEFQNYQTSGGLYRTKVILENGSLKDNIKLTFTYEFLLRLTYNSIQILVVPRIGYVHVNFREDSLFWSYKNNEETKLVENEVKFWVDTAKKEFFFKNKRDVEYVA